MSLKNALCAATALTVFAAGSAFADNHSATITIATVNNGDMSASDYIGLVERRFSNAAIVDTTRRVAFDGSSRHTGFVLPIIRDALAAGAPFEGLALVEALWARMFARPMPEVAALGTKPCPLSAISSRMPLPMCSMSIRAFVARACRMMLLTASRTTDRSA